MAVLEGAAEVTAVAVGVEVAIVAIIARVPGSGPQMAVLLDKGGRGAVGQEVVDVGLAVVVHVPGMGPQMIGCSPCTCR